MFADCLEKVREKSPLIHCITNYVTANDCANALLSCGASPLMSDELEEMPDIAKISSGLCLNIGTLNKRTVKSMITAGICTKENGHVVLLDPVGAGASALRTDTARKIIDTVRPDIIRGNISEIRAVFSDDASTRGADASQSDKITVENAASISKVLQTYSAKINAVIVVTGKIDIVATANNAYFIQNGNSIMSKITGCGCQLSALITAFAAANHESDTDALEAACTSAVCAYGLCGEIACENMCEGEGNASCRNRIIDAIYNLTPDRLSEGQKLLNLR